MNLKNIAIVLTLLSALSGVGYKAWSMDAQISVNTRYRLERQYDRVWDRLDRLERRCGEQAVKCSTEEKKNYRRWSIEKERLKSKLGYQT